MNSYDTNSSATMAACKSIDYQRNLPLHLAKLAHHEIFTIIDSILCEYEEKFRDLIGVKRHAMRYIPLPVMLKRFRLNQDRGLLCYCNSTFPISNWSLSYFSTALFHYGQAFNVELDPMERFLRIPLTIQYAFFALSFSEWEDVDPLLSLAYSIVFCDFDIELWPVSEAPSIYLSRFISVDALFQQRILDFAALLDNFAKNAVCNYFLSLDIDKAVKIWNDKYVVFPFNFSK
jgi:hypothetical protein